MLKIILNKQNENLTIYLKGKLTKNNINQLSVISTILKKYYFSSVTYNLNGLTTIDIKGIAYLRRLIAINKHNQTKYQIIHSKNNSLESLKLLAS